MQVILPPSSHMQNYHHETQDLASVNIDGASVVLLSSVHGKIVQKLKKNAYPELKLDHFKIGNLQLFYNKGRKVKLNLVKFTFKF